MIAVTARALCPEPLPVRVGRLAVAGAEMVVLREKDLPSAELLALASECLEACRGHGTVLSVNSDLAVASRLGIGAVHLPMPVLREADVSPFDLVGASVHSVGEAEEAESLGADYLVAGHVFGTACKSSEPRGTRFLEAVCSAVTVPVYAIGGIGPGNFPSVLACGAAGAAAMSSAMTCSDPGGLVRSLPSARPLPGRAS